MIKLADECKEPVYFFSNHSNKVSFKNFWLKREWLVKEMGRVVEVGSDYGKGTWGKGKKMLVGS